MPPNCHIFALNLILESDDNLQEVSKAKQRKKTSRKQLRKRHPSATVHMVEGPERQFKVTRQEDLGFLPAIHDRAFL
jgi:2-C-methyl-D-erythritol 4-phosphate cytidylyltransferase